MPPRLTKYSKYSKNKMKRSNNVHNEIVLDVIELDPLVDERMDLPGSLLGRDFQSEASGSLLGRDFQSVPGSLQGRDRKGTYGSLNNECLICLEILDNDQKKTIVSKNALFEYSSGIEYYMNCNCNIHIHETCMMDWIKQRQNCPICLTSMCKFERWVIIRNLGVIIIVTGAFMCVLLTFMNILSIFIFTSVPKYN